MSDRNPSVRSCLESNAAWRRQAQHLREHAAQPHLSDRQRAILLREADAAARQANMWLNGAIDLR
jgi:hypothetical protein